MGLEAELAGGHEGYRHLTQSRVVFGDLDAMGHLNNVALLKLLETSRVDYVVDLGLGRYDELTFVIASLRCDFRAQAHYRDMLTCGTRAARRGRSSLVLEHTVWKQDDTTVATAEAALVTLGEDSTSPAPLPDAWLPTIEEYEGRPIPAKRA